GRLTMVTTLLLGYTRGKGTLNLSGGVVDVGYNTVIARETPSSGSPGRAEVNISGGSFQGKVVYVGYRGSYSPGLDAELNITGGTFRASQLYMLFQCKPGVGNKATLKVGADADVALSDLFQVYATGSSIEMEVASATKNSKITSATSIFLGSGLATLAVNSTGYRPREGDKFTLLAAAPGYYMFGDFSSISSNITRGLPGSAAFTGAVVADPNTAAPLYVVTFQGWTAGDANGDQAVDGSDLALMGGSWMKTGQTWGTCEFTGDASGLVDGSDLALMGGNWMWKLNPAPGGQTALPEPATLALLGLGGMALLRRKRGYGG
ncbi:MAG: PEP-CTERM sorting domain-containing protein, partial [Phycisphaerae bacterium]|nr:PEP-CTERM sorting domain-containing protein [Phycisphaerae bacterium]